MISQLIEAKPEELRVYLEEAAAFQSTRSAARKQSVESHTPEITLTGSVI